MFGNQKQTIFFLGLRVTCDSSAILDFVENKKNNSQDKFLGASEHTQNIKFELYSYITKFWL